MTQSDPAGSGILRSRFFRGLFASYAAILLLTGGLVGWQVNHRLAAGLVTEFQEDLAAHCRGLEPFARGILEGGEGAGIGLELLGPSGPRVTVIRADGTVLAESERDPRTLDDHSHRPEIQQAAEEGLGVARRRSHSFGKNLLYVALRIGPAEAPLGYVRTSLPTERIDRHLASAREAVFFGTGTGVLFALVLGFFVAGRVTRPVTEMTGIARDLSEGRYDSRVRVERTDELGELGEALNRLGKEMSRRIAALSREDAQLRAVLSSMIEGVVAVDEEDRVAFMNEAGRALLDIDAKKTEGRLLWELAPIRELEGLLARVRETKGNELLELDLMRGPKERVFRAHASPFRGGGRAGFVLVLHDITELRHLERVRRDFVANVSHELKTPLTSIQGFVETLLAGALRDERNNERFLQRIEANVKRLTNLVSDLLSLARIESGQLDVERTAVDWREVLDGVLRLRESALIEKGLSLRVVGRDEPLRVLGDREAMTQVLDNLVDNAIKYSSSPGLVTVRLSRGDGVGSIAVEDSGLGIPTPDLDRIFERFFRVDKARSSAAGGTGLGLSIVKNLVLRMEGEVRVTSVEGQGSTFTVELPLAG